MNRYLDIQSQGIPRWLASPPTSPAQRVFWGLLQMASSAPLVPAELARRFGLTVPELSRALFELNRANSLRVHEQAQDHEQDFIYDFALLCEDLRELGGDEAKIMLASDDGLCLAQAGLPEEVCNHQAAVCPAGPNNEFPCVVPIHLGRSVVHLCAHRAILTAGAPLLRLVRRLLGSELRAGARP